MSRHTADESGRPGACFEHSARREPLSSTLTSAARGQTATEQGGNTMSLNIRYLQRNEKCLRRRREGRDAGRGPFLQRTGRDPLPDPPLRTERRSDVCRTGRSKDLFRNERPVSRVDPRVLRRAGVRRFPLHFRVVQPRGLEILQKPLCRKNMTKTGRYLKWPERPAHNR